MFKFVTQSPKSLKRNCDNSEQARKSDPTTTATSSDSLLSGLDKQRNKNFVALKRKNCINHPDWHNRGLDHARPSSADTQLYSKAVKTNAELSVPKNVVTVTLEENEPQKNCQGSVPSRNAAGDPVQKQRLNGAERSGERDCGAATYRPSQKVNVKLKTAFFRNNGYHKLAKTKISAENIENKTGSDGKATTEKEVPHGNGVATTMTHDYYSFSDSESDGTWIDQPSPIRLTASPPLNAVKVPATKFLSPQFVANGWHGETGHSNQIIAPHENGFLHQIQPLNGAENGTGRPGNSLQMQASKLFFNSLKRSTQNAKAVPTFTKPVAKRLQPQQPHSYSRKKFAHPESTFNENARENGGTAPTSGSIFVGGPLFMTEEIPSEECEEAPHDKRAKETIQTPEQTITENSDRISTHKGPLYRSDIRINLHKDSNLEEYVINPNHEQKHSSKNGNIPQQQKTGNGVIKYNGIIGVAEAVRPDNTVQSQNHHHSEEGNISVTNPKSREKTFSKVSGKQRQTMSAALRARYRTHGRGQREHRTSIDDDDATTLTMTTASDYDEELSSTSSDSESTECGSVDSTKRTSWHRGGADPILIHGDARGVNVSTSNFVIRKVERITNHDQNDYSDEPSPLQRQKTDHFSVLQRSISTQSGKLRERLNATADDDSSLFQVTPRGSQDFLAEDSTSGVGEFVEYFKPSKSTTSEPAMQSLPHHSPMSGSPVLPHSRVSQLKGDGSLERPRRSRTLTRVPAAPSSPNRALRSRSLDRAFRSSFTRAISPSRSDAEWMKMRSRSSSMTRKSTESISDGESSLRRGSTRPSTGSLNEPYKPKMDVATSLSALILNPCHGGENDRKTIQEYLKQSSRTNSQDSVDATSNPRFVSQWGSGRAVDSLIGGLSSRSTPASTLERKSALEGIATEEDFSDVSRLAVPRSPSRESRVISKSQTPSRYPAVELSPRSISSLLPSPRHDPESGSDVITIVDNDGIKSRTSVSDHDGARRNSFIEAVSGHTHSSRSGSSQQDDIEDAWNELTIAVRTSKELSTATLTGFKNLPSKKSPAANQSQPITGNEEVADEVNVNMSKHPISKDLAVAVIRRRSTRHESSNNSPRQPKKSQSGALNTATTLPAHPPEKKNHTLQNALKPQHEPAYMNLLNPPETNDDSVIEITAVNCRNPRCRKQMCLEDANSKFKSCHHCYTYYCSQQCRLQHWEKHKLKCVFARANSDCKKVLRMGREEDVVKQAFTRVARTGNLSRGRGCVLVEFSSPDRAERFISEGLLALEALPLYLTVDDIKRRGEVFDENENKTEEDKDGLAHTCDAVYNPDETYVLQVHISVPEEVLSRFDRPYRHRNTQGVLIHAVNPIYKLGKESTPVRPSCTAPETLILTPPTTIPDLSLITSPTGYTYSASTSSSSTAASPLDSTDPGDEENSKLAKRARQLSFINIQRKLREKGVTLRHQYPDVYRKLCAYVDTGTNFTPVVIYPRDLRSGKNFMCLVMPGSEPQILGWVQAPGLLDDIATG